MAAPGSKRGAASLFGIGLCAVEEVAGDEDDVGLELPRHRSDAAGEAHAVDVAEVHVADDERGAAAPGQADWPGGQ